VNDIEPTSNISSIQGVAAITDGYWLNDLSGNGRAAFNANGAYKVFRNVKEYGAKGKLLCFLRFSIRLISP